MAKKRARRRPAKTGRPSFEPTDQHRKTVSIAAGAGCTQDAIAAAIGISKPTLLKHFAVELTNGAQARRIEVIQGLFDAALDGSAAAAKAYLAVGVKPTDAKPPAPDAEKPEPEGKKAAQDRVAKANHVGTEWEHLLQAPKTVQ